jgi:hypothetical protein
MHLSVVSPALIFVGQIVRCCWCLSMCAFLAKDLEHDGHEYLSGSCRFGLMTSIWLPAALAIMMAVGAALYQLRPPQNSNQRGEGWCEGVIALAAFGHIDEVGSRSGEATVMQPKYVGYPSLLRYRVAGKATRLGPKVSNSTCQVENKMQMELRSGTGRRG